MLAVMCKNIIISIRNGNYSAALKCTVFKTPLKWSIFICNIEKEHFSSWITFILLDRETVLSVPKNRNGLLHSKKSHSVENSLITDINKISVKLSIK